MSDPIISNPASVSPGQIAFYDSITPPLAANTYTLEVSQTVKGLAEGSVPPYTLQQTLVVTAPRFRLDPALIHMVFPPANQLGDWYDALPSVVLKDFAFPWLRNINPRGGEDPKAPPWIGLLTIYEAEMPVASQQTSPPDASPKLTFPSTVPVASVLSPGDASILPPDLPDTNGGNDDMALITDMDLAFFRAISPTLAELPYLAHARVVNTDGKVMLGMNDDGCFSVVVGNRVPEQGRKSTVLLVSLEGHQDHLAGGAAIDARYTKIRLVVLGSWSFNTTTTPGSFLAIMANLCDPRNGGVKLLQMPAPKGSAIDPMLEEALALGFVALPYDLRDGETTTALYRGPLSAAPTVEDLTYGPYYFSDHAIHYDPTYGMFDLSYASAFQIGRSLALSDASYAQALIAWRRAVAASWGKQADARTIVQPMASALNGENAPPLGLSGQIGHFFGVRAFAAAPNLPTVVPRSEDPLLFELPGAASAPRDLAADDATSEDPLLRLRAYFTGATKP